MKINTFFLKRLKTGIIVTALILFFGTISAFAEVWYVDGSVVDDSGTGTQESPKKYIDSGIALMVGGDTLIVKDGVYEGNANCIRNPPSGTPDAYTVIRAENDWGVSITDVTGSYVFPCDIQEGYDYIQIQGFKFLSAGSNKCNIDGSYIKVIRCASDGTGGSAASFIAGGHHVLFEECYAYGQGRYPMRAASRRGEYIIFRRCVVRWDYSDTSEPQACFANYDRPHVYFQNCIAIDGKDIRAQDPTYDGLKGFFTPNGAYETHFDGCIVLNIEGGGFWVEDSPVSQVTITNSIAWDCKDLGQAPSEAYDAHLVYIRGDEDGGLVVLDHCTFGSTDMGEGLQISSLLPNATVKNSIIYGITLNSGEYAISTGSLSIEDYNCFYNNTGERNVPGGIGQNSTASINPLTNALTNLVKIEDGSELDGAADNGGDIGATIVKRIGVSGTVYGEMGWNTLTNEDLWPFPNEDQMRSDMRAFSRAAGEAFAGSPAMSGDRGFCANDQTLTTYIWEYLGNQASVSLNTPTELNATSISSSSILLAWKDNSFSEDGSKIERKKWVEGSYEQVATVGPNVFIYSDTGLENQTTYYYRVRAYHGVDNSGYSNTASTTTSNASSAPGSSTSGTGGGGGSGGGCFIATATYGSKTATEVEVLCRFRDEFLTRTYLGNKFIELYYTLSPPIAKCIESRSWVKRAVRLSLQPMVWLVEKFMSRYSRG